MTGDNGQLQGGPDGKIRDGHRADIPARRLWGHVFEPSAVAGAAGQSVVCALQGWLWSVHAYGMQLPRVAVL